MATSFPIPLIRPEYYNAFKREVGPDLADTYDKWRDLHAKDSAERIRRGESLVEIHVDPYEFIRFVQLRGVAGNLKTLLDFTIEKAAGKHY